MNSVEEAALLVHRDAIVQNVDFVYIKDKLLAYEVLNIDDIEDIDCQKTKSAKVRKLLDLLPKKENQETFTTFVKILEVDYEWLAETLSKSCNNRDSPDAASHLHDNPLNEVLDNSLMGLQRSLICGGIPFPPAHLISRSAKVLQIRQCLRDMALGQFVVLHGMAGAGKSVLAAETVRCVDLTTITFDNNVFWLTIGQTDKDTLLTKMQALCERLDHNCLPPLSIDQATERLRRLMMDPKRKNSLLILDDVWRGEVVRAFDFGCKILMTTRDASVTDVVHGRAVLIKIQDGFTEEESMMYLANFINISEQDLPEQASQIYSESKGSPLILSLLAPLLAERGETQLIDTHRWDHYLEKLRDRKYAHMRRQSSPYNYETINEAISISFNHLDEETRRCLNDFVIFLDDVNIPAKVLEVLWQCTRYEMEEKISLLVAKSLVVKHVLEQSSMCSVLYGIHDLLLDYLKCQLNSEKQKAAHRKLIDAYMRKCNSDFGALPNDNYIFWFLGYHLYKAEYTEIFPKAYLNLHFISAKLRATGPSDLLNDYRKYGDYISGNGGENLPRVEEYTRFVRTCGHILVQCPHLDIIQLALQQPKSNAVYLDALEIARKAKGKLYFECLSGSQPRGMSRNEVLRSTVLSYGHVTAACFTEDGHRLLSAIGDGQIRMWDVDSGKELHRFTGHNGCVHQLSLSSDAKRLVSSSADGTSKVWDLATVTRKLDEIGSRATKTPSPRMRQDSWHNMFDVNGRTITDNSETTYTGHTNEVLCARFSENGALIVSCGHDHTARIWLSIASMELGVLKHPESVMTCCFSESGYFVATGCSDSSIRLWSVSTHLPVFLIHEQSSSPRILFLSFLSDTSLVSVSDTEILQLDLNFLSSNLGQMAPTESSYSVTPIGRASSNCCFQCAAVSRNRQQLAVATSNDNILLYSVPEASQITDFSGHTGSVACLHFSPEATDQEPSKWLLSGSSDETLKVWNVSDIDLVKESLFSSVYYAAFPSGTGESLTIASAGTDNCLQVFNGINCDSILKTEGEVGADEIQMCILSNSTSMMAWATLSGVVKLMSLVKKEVKILGHHSDAKVNLLKFSPSDVLVVSGSSEGCIKIWKSREECVTIQGPKKGVVDCYFIDNESSLMVCGADGSIRVWNVETGLATALLQGDTGQHLTCVDWAKDYLRIAQGTTTNGLQLIQIQFDSKKPSRQPSRLGSEMTPVRVCRFASQVQYLAVGYDRGLIEVFDYTRHVLLSTLEGHHSWVRDLQWCHNSPFFQLISIGERIAWWDLNSHRKGSSSTSGGYGFPLAPITPSDRFNCPLQGPIQTVEFQGRYASKLFVSPDGRVLVTVTDSGILYVLRQLTDL